MSTIRRRLTMLAMTGAALVAACAPSEHAGLAPDIRRELEDGEDAVERWIAQSRGGAVPPDDVVVALGYLERLRLGLGSPFRLVESVLADPRLEGQVRQEAAWALLARTLHGLSYQVDPVALDRAGTASIPNWPGVGRYHLQLIENTVTEARDPRSGELAVRLAYRLAALEGSVPAAAPTVAIRTAALLRDREVAREDVARLLRSAEVVAGDPLSAVARWRSERWLAVEAPALTALPDAVEREALELVPRLSQAIRMLGPRIGEITRLRPPSAEVNRSLLAPRVAERLAAIADSINMPARAPVAISARTHRRELLNQPWITGAEQERRERLTETGDEERLVARLALLDRSSRHDAVPSLTALWTAVALRPWGQEPVWFPGGVAPSSRELEERFGFAAVRFGDDVPAEWRAYYRRLLATSVQDMQRVLPALDLRGLRVRFGWASRGEGTLAMHDPARRELLLPPGSSGGTIAHEVAHDLDWQTSLKRYRVRGDYASDRAERVNDRRLAARVRILGSTAAAEAAPTERLHAHAQRPAENFARAVDWFVVASLAAEGRSNGYLSSIQDDVLTGYGTVRSPDFTGRAGESLISIFDEVAPLYPATRQQFLQQYGTQRSLSATDLVRSFAELELPEPETEVAALAGLENRSVAAAFRTIERQRVAALSAVDSWVCRGPGGVREPELETARRLLVSEAAAARARGVAIRHARRLGGEPAARWVARQLYGGPWPAVDLDDEMAELLTPLVDAAREAGEVEAVERAGFRIGTGARYHLWPTCTWPRPTEHAPARAAQ